MELIDVIHQILQQGQAASSPTDLVIGSVVSVSPLAISINPQMQPIKSSLLYLTWPVMKHEIDLGEVEIPSSPSGGSSSVSLGKILITRDLIKGDRVLMLRVQKGQKFIVLSRIEGG